MNVDEKLLQNVLDEAKRLNSQLKDLEEYKADFEVSEYEQIKKDTLNQLIDNAKLIDNFSKGSIKTSNSIEEARKKIAETIAENYNVKNLMGTFLSSEVYYLRANLQNIISKYSIKRLSYEEFQVQVSELLLAIGKVTDLNDEEKKLNEQLKNKVLMEKYSKDEGFDSVNIESKLKQK